MPPPSSLRSGSSSALDCIPKASYGPAHCGSVDAGIVAPGSRSEEGGCKAPPSALVVFADHADCAWLTFLRRGFRHCFVVLRAGSLWLACEPLTDRIELDALALPPGFDLAAFYAGQGHRVIQGCRPRSRPRQAFAPAPLTCVTVVKRLLGIRAPWVWTPWQLYAHLTAPEIGFRPWSQSPPAAEEGRRRFTRASHS
jgi:hypothetical protein